VELAAVYLEKFKNFGFKDQILKEALISVIKELLKCEIEKKDIDIRDGVVRINATGALKSEIFIHKNTIQTKTIEKINDPKNLITKIS